MTLSEFREEMLGAKYTPESMNGFKTARELPKMVNMTVTGAYNLLDAGLQTAVKNQGQCGSKSNPT